MSAYLIGHIRIKDPDLWRQYVAGVARSLEPFAARILFRGTKAAVLAGAHPYDHTVVIAFTDQDSLGRWFHSELYQSLIPLRDRAADVVIISYDA
ncbi:DUF1330 domain-containing protein [Geoalkalibacter halelectricus]|uniref:DUF1330 domain-containing protein n=1 Tax=Geoalkalibacter halelectricus TaxID=2847045 RepID=A0ABY5ZFL6_9BACT|nr:DUF1330 domain-containing protein [Geoalkalibacter halelectricus]UWZ77896.1 DUF1330 domain-containing protein [Geoalkalibacter halelectricus]